MCGMVQNYISIRIAYFGAILMCIALLLAPAPLPAQVLYGSLVGNVTDPSGSAVARAKVTVVSQETNLTRETVTNEEGQYSFPGIPTGVYTVKVAMAGFTEFGRSGVPVTLNSTSRLNAALQLGQVQATVEVTAQAAPLLQTDRADVRLEMTTKQLESLPVAQGRQLPGAVPHDARFHLEQAREQQRIEPLDGLPVQRQRRQPIDQQHACGWREFNQCLAAADERRVRTGFGIDRGREHRDQ